VVRRPAKIVAPEAADAEQLAQRAARAGEAVEHPVRQRAVAPLDLLTGAAQRAVGVALPAAPFIEDRAEAVRHRLRRRERRLGLREQRAVRARERVAQRGMLLTAD
jgi:hypothetical protein